MPKAKTRSPRQYKGGKTLNVPCNSQSGLVSVGDCRTLLAIATRDTINDYLKTLELFGRDFLNWEEFFEVLKLQAFLGLKPGYNSKKMYLVLRSGNAIAEIFDIYKIDVEARLERIQDEYNNQ